MFNIKDYKIMIQNNNKYKKTIKIKKIYKKINKLPIEIIIKIFEFLNIEDLCEFKNVCLYWNKIINELLIIDELNMSKRKEYALNIYNDWSNCSNGCISFRIYISNSNNIFDENFTLHSDFYNLRDVNYLEIFNLLEYNAKSGGAYTRGVKDPIESVWKTIMGLTGLDFEKFENKSYKNNNIKSFMNKYKWYIFEHDEFFIRDTGIIVFDPDKKTFAVLSATDYD